MTEKRALITGASGGIGKAIAETLHAYGATVGISGTRKETLQQLADQLGERAHVLPCDLTDREAVAALPGIAEETLGGIDILVCNAGRTRDNLSMRMSDDEWDEVIEINLGASFRLIRGTLRGMMKRRWGRIIATTSVVGHTGNPGQANYTASKAALTAMIKSLAAEVASRNITANTVAPGLIETAMTDKLDDAQRERIVSRIPLGRLGTPADVAATVVFLASPEAAYVTGQTFHVNGGLAMI